MENPMKIRVQPQANWRNLVKDSIYDIEDEPEIHACFETGMLIHIPFPGETVGKQVPYPALSYREEARSAPTSDLAEFSPATPSKDATLSDI